MSNLPVDHQRNEQPANDAGYTALMAIKPGERLREARVARKLDLEAASHQLNLSVSVVRALENDDYAALPSSTFVKGYIRSYARMLRLPPDDLVRAFEYQTGVHSSMDEQHPVPEKRVRKKGPRVLLLILALVVLVLGLFFLFSGGDQDAESSTSVTPSGQDSVVAAVKEIPKPEPQRQTAPPVIEIRNEGRVVETRVVEPTDQVAPVLEAGVEVGSSESVSEIEPEPEPEPEPVDVPLAQADSGPDEAVESAAPQKLSDGPADSGLLLMVFSSDCWVEIRNQNEKLIHADLHRAGTRYEKSFTEPFEVKLGNGNAVQLSYNGDPVVFAPSKRTSVARISFGQ